MSSYEQASKVILASFNAARFDAITTQTPKLRCLNCGVEGHVWIYLHEPGKVQCGSCEKSYDIHEKIMEVSLNLNAWKEVAKWIEKSPMIKTD